MLIDIYDSGLYDESSARPESSKSSQDSENLKYCGNSDLEEDEVIEYEEENQSDETCKLGIGLSVGF